MARPEPARLTCPACGEELLLPVTVWGDKDSPKPLFHVAISTEPVERHTARCTPKES